MMIFVSVVYQKVLIMCEILSQGLSIYDKTVSTQKSHDKGVVIFPIAQIGKQGQRI